MKNKGIFISILLFGLLSIGIFSNILFIDSNEISLQSKSNPTDLNSNLLTASLSSHDPIIINANSEFNSTNGVKSGSGTQIDPYIISDWQIDASGENTGLKIENTDAFTIIQNCIIESSGMFGIRILSAKNVIVQNCTIRNIISEDGNEGTPGGYGGTVDSVYGFYINTGTNITLIQNSIENILGGDGGRGGDGNGASGGDGGNGAYAYGIYAVFNNYIKISDNTITDIKTGNGGDGGDGDMAPGPTFDGFDGGDGGNAYSAYGVYFTIAHNGTLKNNTICGISSGNGGKGAVGTDSGSTQGNGGNGGNGGHSSPSHGLWADRLYNFTIIDNQVYDIDVGNAANAGNGGHGGDAIGATFQSGNGGNGGNVPDSQSAFYIRDCESLLVSKNAIHDIYSGTNGNGANAGSNSSGATAGTNGIDGILFNHTGVKIKDNENLTFYENNLYNFHDAIDDFEITFHVEGCQNSKFYANDFVMRNISIDNTNPNDWNNDTMGNYWGTYVDEYFELTDENGISDNLVNLGGTSNENDTMALMYPFYGDYDVDGLINGYEYWLKTEITCEDTDGDYMPDGWEVLNGYNPLSLVDGIFDDDFDGLTNGEEYIYGTDPKSADSDDDGFSDYDELVQGTDPLDSSSKPTSETIPKESEFTEFMDDYGTLILAGLLLVSIMTNIIGKKKKAGSPNLSPE